VLESAQFEFLLLHALRRQISRLPPLHHLSENEIRIFIFLRWRDDFWSKFNSKATQLSMVYLITFTVGDNQEIITWKFASRDELSFDKWADDDESPSDSEDTQWGQTNA
jgi:hypothetical protein